MNENDKTEILEPVETPAENITEPSKDGRKCPKWLPPLVAAVCAVILVVAGIIGWNAYSGAKLAEAKEACVTAADTVRNNANEYNALLNGDAADAAAVATGGATASAAVLPGIMPFKALLQLMGAVIFVMVLLAIGWAAAHASGVWPE